MFEYHGWVTVRATPGATAEDEARHKLGDQIGTRAGNLRKAEDDLLDIRWVNGRQVIHFSGVRNRRSTSAEDMLGFFAWIGEIAPGSYGLLHYWDDEDPRGEDYENMFRTRMLARGKVTEHADTFLSPCVPTIENEVDEAD